MAFFMATVRVGARGSLYAATSPDVEKKNMRWVISPNVLNPSQLNSLMIMIIGVYTLFRTQVSQTPAHERVTSNLPKISGP